MKKILVLLLFLQFAFSVQWCDIGDVCNSSYSCRAYVTIDQPGIIKIPNMNLSDLLYQCGVSGEADNLSIRVTLENNLTQYNFTGTGLFFNATTIGQYFIYFSNLTPNESRTEPNNSLAIEASTSIDCYKPGLCTSGNQQCPKYSPALQIVYKAVIGTYCYQAIYGVYCTGSSIFGDCRCTTGYNSGYTAYCEATCFGNFSNGSEIGVSASLTEGSCETSVFGKFYYLAYDFDKNIESTESYLTYSQPMVAIQEPTPVYVPPVYNVPVFSSAAPAPTFKPLKPFLNITILEPQNNTLIDDQSLELTAKIENNTEIQCSLAIDGTETNYYLENNTLTHAFFIDNGEHMISLSCNNNETAKEAQISFSVVRPEKNTTIQTTGFTPPITSKAASGDNSYFGALVFLAAAIIISSRRLLSRARRHMENSN
jgi:hypothetical protein